MRDMEVDGNVWWDPIFGVSSHILKELSSFFVWEPSTSSSTKAPLFSFKIIKHINVCFVSSNLKVDFLFFSFFFLCRKLLSFLSVFVLCK